MHAKVVESHVPRSVLIRTSVGKKEFHGRLTPARATEVVLKPKEKLCSMRRGDERLKTLRRFTRRSNAAGAARLTPRGATCVVAAGIRFTCLTGVDHLPSVPGQACRISRPFARSRGRTVREPRAFRSHRESRGAEARGYSSVNAATVSVAGTSGCAAERPTSMCRWPHAPCRRRPESWPRRPWPRSRIPKGTPRTSARRRRPAAGGVWPARSGWLTGEPPSRRAPTK